MFLAFVLVPQKKSALLMPEYARKPSVLESPIKRASSNQDISTFTNLPAMSGSDKEEVAVGVTSGVGLGVTSGVSAGTVGSVEAVMSGVGLTVISGVGLGV